MGYNGVRGTQGDRKTIYPAGADPAFVARRLTPNGAARPVVLPPGLPRLPRACKDVYAKHISTSNHICYPRYDTKSKILGVSAPDIDTTIKRERGSIFGVSLFGTWKTMVHLVGGEGTLASLAGRHTSHSHRSRKKKDTQQSTLTVWTDGWHIVMHAVGGSMSVPNART